MSCRSRCARSAWCTPTRRFGRCNKLSRTRVFTTAPLRATRVPRRLRRFGVIRFATGLQVTGEINEETLRSVNSSSNSVASASQPASKPAAIQPNSVRPDASAPLSQSSPPPSFNQPNRPLETNPPYSASFYQSAPLRVNRRMIAGAQYQLMSRGYYRGRVDGKYGSRTAFAVRAFQSSAGLPPTGRLDMQTLEALGSSGTDFAYLAPEPAPVRNLDAGEEVQTRQVESEMEEVSSSLGRRRGR